MKPLKMSKLTASKLPYLLRQPRLSKSLDRTGLCYGKWIVHFMASTHALFTVLIGSHRIIISSPVQETIAFGYSIGHPWVTRALARNVIQFTCKKAHMEVM